MLQGFEPIAICDKFICFNFSELEAISLRKTFYVTFNLFIEAESLYSIQFSQVPIQNDLNITNRNVSLMNRNPTKDFIERGLTVSLEN